MPASFSGELRSDLGEGVEQLDMGELKEEPPEGAKIGDILTVEVGDGLEVVEHFLVDVDIFGDCWLDGLEFFLTVLLVVLPLTRNCGWMSMGLAKARDDAIFLSKLSSASSSEDVFTRGMRPDSRACTECFSQIVYGP